MVGVVGVVIVGCCCERAMDGDQLIDDVERNLDVGRPPGLRPLVDGVGLEHLRLLGHVCLPAQRKRAGRTGGGEKEKKTGKNGRGDTGTVR